MGLAAGCVRARSSSSPLRGGHCPPLAASTSRLEVWLRCSVHVGCGTPLFRRVVGCRRPARVREGHAEARRRVAGSALHRARRGRRGEAEAAGAVRSVPRPCLRTIAVLLRLRTALSVALRFRLASALFLRRLTARRLRRPLPRAAAVALCVAGERRGRSGGEGRGWGRGVCGGDCIPVDHHIFRVCAEGEVLKRKKEKKIPALLEVGSCKQRRQEQAGSAQNRKRRL